MNFANDNEPRKSIPLITRLRRADRHGDVHNLARFAIPTTPPQAANDDELADGFGIDTVYEIRPTQNEIMRAGKDGIRHDGQGRITAWRATDTDGKPSLDENGDEKWYRAREGYRQSKGSRRKSLKAIALDSAQHLSLRGCGGFPESLPYAARKSDGAAYWRIRHAAMCMAMVPMNAEARGEIDRLGIGATVSFARARANAGLPPAERGETAIARGAGFLAGQIAPNDLATAGSFVGAPDAAENAMIAQIDAPRTTDALGDHASILQDSLDGQSAREIAAKRGWGDSKSAEQRAVRAQDRALAALSEVQRKAA